jgi:hypothetical protein
MVVTVEIKTGSRRVISYLLSPLPRTSMRACANPNLTSAARSAGAHARTRRISLFRGDFGVPPRIPSLDEIIKIMIIYELHGLNDIAFDTATRFSSELRLWLDIERAKRLLLEDPVKCTAPVSVESSL